MHLSQQQSLVEVEEEEEEGLVREESRRMSGYLEIQGCQVFGVIPKKSGSWKTGCFQREAPWH